MHMNMHKPTGLHFPIDFSTRLRFALEFVIAWLTHAITLLQSSTRNFFDSVRLLRAISGSTSRAHYLTPLMMMQLSRSLQSFKRDVFKSREIVICHRVSLPSGPADILSLLAPNEKRTKSSMGIWEYGSQKRVAVSHIHFIHIACSYAAHITGNLFEWKWKNLFSSSTVNLGPFVYVN